MKADDIVTLLQKFKWNTLQRMNGCAHSSIIGFISTEWINQSEDNSILDGAPSSITGQGISGQKNADILLCKGDKPFIIVEVETVVDKYKEKIKSLQSYLHNNDDFNGIEFGLLFMTNLCNGNMKYKHNWDQIKKQVETIKKAIVLVSVEKSKIPKSESILGRLRSRNDYYPWEIRTIDYWVYTLDNIREGTLWKK